MWGSRRSWRVRHDAAQPVVTTPAADRLHVLRRGSLCRASAPHCSRRSNARRLLRARGSRPPPSRVARRRRGGAVHRRAGVARASRRRTGGWSSQCAVFHGSTSRGSCRSRRYGFITGTMPRPAQPKTHRLRASQLAQHQRARMTPYQVVSRCLSDSLSRVGARQVGKRRRQRPIVSTSLPRSPDR